MVVGVENDSSVQTELSYWELYLRNHIMIYIQISKRFYLVFVEWWVVVGGGGGVGVGKGLNDSSVQTEPAIYDWIDTGTI